MDYMQTMVAIAKAQGALQGWKEREEKKRLFKNRRRISLLEEIITELETAGDEISEAESDDFMAMWRDRYDRIVEKTT